MGSLDRGCRTFACRCAIAGGFAAIALMIAGVSHAAAGDDSLPATGTTAVPSVTEPASTAAPAATDAPAPAETGSPVAEPPTSAGAPGTVGPDAEGAKDPSGRTEGQRWSRSRGGRLDDWGAHGSADADAAGLTPDATVRPGEEAPAGAVAPTDPGDDDATAGIGDGDKNPESVTDSGASPSPERGNAIADSTGADAPATASADPTSVVDSGTTTAGTAPIGLPPASSAPPAAAVFAPAPAYGDPSSMEQRSLALAGRGAAAARLRGRRAATLATLRSRSAPGPAAVALQPFGDAPSLGWKPAERSGAAAKPQRAKRDPATRADTGYPSGAPSAPNGQGVGTSSSATSAGGGVSSVEAALLLGFTLAVAQPLRRHRLRLVVSAPTAFSTLLERPG